MSQPHQLIAPILVLVSLFATSHVPATFRRTNAPTATLELSIDVSESPDLRDFADHAKVACEKMYSIICDDLASDGFTPARSVKLIFKYSYDGVAATSGDEITCSPKWFREHPDDIGAIVHELTHVIQAYPKYDPVWLVEGIADYERFFKYEPASKRPHPDPAKVKNRDSYQTAAAFLDWTARTYDRDLVHKLNADLRNEKYSDDAFEKYTGKKFDALWDEFRASLRSRQARQDAEGAKKKD